MTKKTPEVEDKKTDDSYTIVSRKGTWFFSNASFPLEDPTNAPGSLPRFEPRAYTQADETGWTESQWKAGTFDKWEGYPHDEGSKLAARPEEVKAAAASAVKK